MMGFVNCLTFWEQDFPIPENPYVPTIPQGALKSISVTKLVGLLVI
jgi:hypothetical protein